MPKSNAVWGIDIGQCALKALLCRPHEKDSDQIVVESFDYIEYPKILSQPEAEPEELVREALSQFLERNDVANDRVAISVSGQSGLARFIKLPPVESKKIPDIVKYEARQQIPFALEDVVWDYQQLAGGSEEDGFALEPEVGLFAMKRDQVTRALQPLEEAGIEVDFIQLAPLAVYNFVCFDRLEDFKQESYDPQHPPESTVVISIGTDTTDLVVTNGFRVWQRNIPIGGSHFTRALSKELKLTFVKAEHLKRNATEADDPKAVFQAMRPVFSDLLSEIQRSLGYFTSIDKTAKLNKIIALGNAMKLPGLQRYLSQNLEQEVTPITEFQNLSAGSAAGKAQFKDNVLSFPVAYGLCLQGLGKSELRTNLLPEEIVRTRLIRSKKPWAVAGAAAILAGLTFNYLSHASALSEVVTDSMASAETQAKSVQTTSANFKSQHESVKTEFETVKAAGEKLTSNVGDRLRWLELFKAIDAALPRDSRPSEERQQTAEDISAREELHIVAIESREYADLGSEYFTNVQSAYSDFKGADSAGAASTPAADAGIDPAYADPAAAAPMADASAAATGGDEDLSGKKGWVIQLTGYHYHNEDRTNQTGEFVNNTLIKNLEEGTVELPDGTNGALMEVPIKDLKISHVWRVADTKLESEMIDPDAMMRGMDSTGGGGGGRGGEYSTYRPGNLAPGEKDPRIELKRYNFIVQFVWQPKTRAEREEIAQARAVAEQAAAEAAAAAAAAGENGAPPEESF